MAKKTSKNKIHHPDDAFFKSVMSRKESAISYFQTLHPEWIDRLDLKTMEQQQETFLVPDFKTFDADITYRCKLKDSDKELSISFLWENKSKPDKYIYIQVGLYLFLAYNKMARTKGKILEPIIPLFFYNGKPKWTPQTLKDLFKGHSFLNEIEPFLPKFDYYFTDITKVPKSQLLNIEASFFKSAMFAMASKHNLNLLKENFSVIFDIDSDDENALISIGHYIFAIFERQPESIEKELPKFDSKIQSNIMSTLEILQNRGKEEGKLEEKKAIAKRLHGQGFSILQISKMLDTDEQFVLETLGLTKK